MSKYAMDYETDSWSMMDKDGYNHDKGDYSWNWDSSSSRDRDDDDRDDKDRRRGW